MNNIFISFTGIMWEKQNPLVKKDIFGFSSNNEEDLTARGRRTDLNSLHTQGMLKETLGPENSTQIGNSLEVSGGSRQGSFRSSFRRRGNAAPGLQQNEHYPNDHYKYQDEMQTSNPNIDSVSEISQLIYPVTFWGILFSRLTYLEYNLSKQLIV